MYFSTINSYLHVIFSSLFCLYEVTSNQSLAMFANPDHTAPSLIWVHSVCYHDQMYSEVH